MRPGSWVSARVLTYVYRSFPDLWTPELEFDPNNSQNECTTFSYRWRAWVEKLERMDKQRGAWAVLAERLAYLGTTHGQVQDIAKAIIELAIRDAEILRNALRPNPLPLPAYRVSYHDDTPFDQIPNTVEQAFMARIRSATGYQPRLRRVEKCIYTALAICNVSIIHAIAAMAPKKSPVFDIIREATF